MQVILRNALSNEEIFKGKIQSFSEIPDFALYTTIEVNGQEAHEDFLQLDPEEQDFDIRVVRLNLPILTLVCGNVVLMRLQAKHSRASSIVESAGDLKLLSRLGLVGKAPGTLTAMILHPKMDSQSVQVFEASRPDYNWQSLRSLSDNYITPPFIRCYSYNGNMRAGLVQRAPPGHRRWYHEFAYMALKFPYILPAVAIQKSWTSNTSTFHNVPIWKLVQKQLQSHAAEVRMHWTVVGVRQRYHPTHAMFNLFRDKNDVSKKLIHAWIDEFYYGFEDANRDLYHAISNIVLQIRQYHINCFFN